VTKPSRRQRVALVILPPLLLASTVPAYRWLGARLGPKWGYFAGFLFTGRAGACSSPSGSWDHGGCVTCAGMSAPALDGPQG
jgi:hypothetical protein